MSYSLFLLLLATFITFFLGVFILLKNHKNSLNRSFFFATLGIFIWSFSWCVIRLFESKVFEDIIIRTIYAAPFITVFSYFYLCLLLTEVKKTLLKITFYFSIFSYAVIFYFAFFTNLLVFNPYNNDNGAYGFEFGIFYYIGYLPTMPLLFLTGFVLLIRKIYLMKSGNDRDVLVYFLISGFLGSIGGLIMNLFLPTFGIFRFQIWGATSAVVFSLANAYSMLRHQFMDVRVFAGKFFLAFMSFATFLYIFFAIDTDDILIRTTLFLIVSVLSIFTYRSIQTEVRQRQEIQALEHLDKAKSEFISLASHQLKSPLQGAFGSLDQLHTTQDPQVSAAVRSTKQNLHRISRLTDDLLSLSRLESGDASIKKQTLTTTEFFPTLLQTYEQKAEEKGIGLFLNTDPIEFCADRSKLEEALGNIIDNAITYTPEEGEVEISIQTTDNTIEIRISDTGPGIPEEDKDTIFQKFTRGQTGKDSGAKGSGLGLFIAKSYIEMHGGTIAIDPKAQTGTTFIIILPLGNDE
jgi:signal transduction histidine kinase